VTRVVAGILRREQRILICQRARGRKHAMKWEFPGGKLEAGEEEPAALARELREELGIVAKIGGARARVRHRYGEGDEVEVVFFEVGEWEGTPETREFEALAWVAPAELGGYDFLAADRPVLELLMLD